MCACVSVCVCVCSSCPCRPQQKFTLHQLLILVLSINKYTEELDTEALENSVGWRLLRIKQRTTSGVKNTRTTQERDICTDSAQRDAMVCDAQKAVTCCALLGGCGGEMCTRRLERYCAAAFLQEALLLAACIVATALLSLLEAGAQFTEAVS